MSKYKSFNAEGQRKEMFKMESQYASSLFRTNRMLEGVPQLVTYYNVSTVSHCVITCLKHTSGCKSLNWGSGGECTLLSDSICANETLELTEKHGFAYYDLMDAPEFERKHLKDEYCRQFGKCSGRCYPRKPYYVDTAMTWDEATRFCNRLNRALPQPHNKDIEGIWMYADNTPVSDSFSAWALGQPDNGGPFGSSKEDCGVIGEK
ncbi:unnamed protein product, partial [Medioppia subpectinata]